MIQDQRSDIVDHGSTSWIIIVQWSFLVSAVLMMVGRLTITELARRSPIHFEDEYVNAAIKLLEAYCRFMHGMSSDPMELPEGNSVFAVGPHLMGPVDGINVALAISRNKDKTPPSFLYTEYFNRFPLIERIAKALELIPVTSRPLQFKDDKKHKFENDNQKMLSPTIAAGVNALLSGRNLVIFPEGQVVRRHHPVPKIHTGAIIMALMAKKTFCVLNLSGAKSMLNPWIHRMIQDTTLYQVFLTMLVPNDMNVSLVKIFDKHVHKDLSDQEKADYMNEIIEFMYNTFHAALDIDSSGIVKEFPAVESKSSAQKLKIC